jgi:DNA-binding transcriptional LysR family regulator
MFDLRNIDLNLLPVFEAVYEEGTVSAAAKRLRLSQSATSHAVGRLRDVSGGDLFLRHHKGLRPTPLADSLYPEIKRALQVLRMGLQDANGFDPAVSSRRFHVALPHPMGPFIALELRRLLAERAPEIMLTVETTTHPGNLANQLRDGTADLALDWLPLEFDPFINKHVFSEGLVLAVRAGHPFIKPDSTLEELRRARMIGTQLRRAPEDLPEPLVKFMALGLLPDVRASELLEIPLVVACTDLIGLLTSSMAATMNKRLNLQIIPIPADLPPLPIYLMWHESRRNDSGHVWLRGLIEAELPRLIDDPGD